jgi:hypothetical protein
LETIIGANNVRPWARPHPTPTPLIPNGTPVYPSTYGDTKFELKALELLGKHSDIGLFTERSEITINYKNPEDLENAIKERVKRLLNADVVDVTPIGADLDDVLGVAEVPEREIGPLGDELKDDGEADANPTT